MKQRKLDRAIRKFVLWHKLVRAWHVLQTACFAGLTVFAAYVLADRLIYLQLEYVTIGLSIASVALAVVLISFLAMANRRSVVSYLVDRNAGLKNLISSGLEAQGRADPISVAVVNRAEAAVTQQHAADALPFGWRWTGKFSFIPLICICGFMFIPNQDLLNREHRHREQQQAAGRRRNSVKLLEQKIAKIEKSSKTVKSINGKDIADDLKKLENELKSAASTKEALAKLNKLENRYREELEKKRDFENSTRNLAARLNAKDLNKESADQLRKLASHLRQGNLNDAAENMRNLARQLLSDDLTEEEKQALARELAKVMDQFQGDKDAEDLAKLLKQAQKSPPASPNQQNQPNQSNPGQNQTTAQNQKQPKANNNPANQQNPNQQQNQPNPNQQPNQQQHNCQNPANCKNGSCKNSRPGSQNQAGNQGQGGQSGQPGGQSRQGDGQNTAQTLEDAAGRMNQMADNMEQMDSLKQMQEGLDGARKEMLGKEFEGFDPKQVEEYLKEESQASLGKKGSGGTGQGGKGKGNGTGGAGQGRGGRPPERMTATGLEKQMSNSKMQKGKILNQRWIYGVPEAGDAQREYTNEIRSAKEDAMNSLAKSKVPREYEEHVKQYFSNLEPQDKDGPSTD